MVTLSVAAVRATNGAYLVSMKRRLRQLDDDGATIKRDEKEGKEEENKNCHLQERYFGSFERDFPVPEGVDVDKFEAKFNNGILTVALPKKPEAQKPERKVKIRGT